MTQERFELVVNGQLELCKQLLTEKKKEYADKTSDRLQGFKTAAELQHISQLQALSGMMAKHTTSIYDMCESGSDDIDKWNEKITDHINYLLFLRAIVEEELHGGESI